VFIAGLVGPPPRAHTSLVPPRTTPQEQVPEGKQDGQRTPVFGKITATHDGSFDIATPKGETVKVKLTDKTQFRKDRQPAKRADFKAGDVIIIRGEENSDHTWTAQLIAGRTMNGQNARMTEGTLGKDYVLGEVKSIDAPKLSVLRSDNVTQILELNEDTSLHKGRDSITMADIQVGDHVMARGAMQNDAFVPKVLVVFDPQQWNRMQERLQQFGIQVDGSAPAGKTAKPQKPSERQN